jgi:hypothetical protein
MMEKQDVAAQQHSFFRTGFSYACTLILYNIGIGPPMMLEQGRRCGTAASAESKQKDASTRPIGFVHVRR